MKAQKVDDYRWRIPREGRMRVPGLVVASELMMPDIRADASLDQVANVAHLPGILGNSMAMPDIHGGYGFPIGGVAAFDEHEGVLSPGGVGYDINCGVRLLRTNLQHADVANRMEDLSMALVRAIPSGVGSRSQRRLTFDELDDVMEMGAFWAVKEGFGRGGDLETAEENGRMRGADPEAVSLRAKERGLPQLGSLGSGNHFCEVGRVVEIYDGETARVFGLEPGQITVLIHSGSRGFGHQICDDYLHDMIRASQRYGIELPDRQLCAAPLTSPEAKRYFGAMACAVNFAFANRQMITHSVRQAFERFFGDSAQSLRLELVYDVCHNIAKWEEHEIDGAKRRVCVHRKGATRAFPAGHPEIPARYREVGQPVLVPGDMGRYSFVLVGSEQAMRETWGSCCHGAGRRLSRKAALKLAGRKRIFDELSRQGVWVRSESKRTVAEEIPEAYKDVADVVEVIHNAGIAHRVAKLQPLAVVKG
ncbi:MAG: RtcB family protein [Polyangiaceae bacterium]|nr:RtcB family protein [Polyangiaceae bacterium]